MGFQAAQPQTGQVGVVRVTVRQVEEAAHTKQKGKDLRPRRQALLPPIPALKMGKLNLMKCPHF